MIRYLLLPFIIALLPYTKADSQIMDKGKPIPFSATLDSLNTAYADCLAAQKGGITLDFLSRWGDRYWDLVMQNPEHPKSPQATEKAFQIYSELKNPNIILQKLNKLPIHSRAMSAAIPYWQHSLKWNGEESTPSDHPFSKKLHHIIQESESEQVQIAAHYYLAKWLINYNYYDEAQKHLRTLELTHQVHAGHKKYGEGINEMNKTTSSFSAGNPMPSFQITTLKKGRFSESDLRGKITFLYFYTPYCGPCLDMYPKINEASKRYADDRFQVIGFPIDMKHPNPSMKPAAFKSFLAKYDIQWPQAIQFDLWQKLNIEAASTGYLVNQDGMIVRISYSDQVSNATKGLQNTSLMKAIEILTSSESRLPKL